MLVLALVLSPIIATAIRNQDLGKDLMSPRQVSVELERLKDVAAGELKASQAKVASYPPSLIAIRLDKARAMLEDVNDELRAGSGLWPPLRPRAILERKQLELERSALEGEITLLEAAGEGHAIRNRLASVLAPTEAAIAAAKRRCDAANAEMARFRNRNILDKSVRNALSQEERRRAEAAARSCADYQRRVAIRRAALEKVRALRAELARTQRTYAEAGREAQARIALVKADPGFNLQSILATAAVLLAAIIATPYLIRLFFYFILAPIAERRPVVRLLKKAGTEAVPHLLQPSATSAPIMLDAGEELLVRQRFLQSTSSTGSKSTQALLDWRHPFSSLASGLAFLTRIEGAGDTTTVSAVHDPFAEVAVLGLPAGAACVLQPRALVAVVQPSGRPIRITSHWRLGSLHAWLTLQLRFLMFHGPAKLVVKGGRGVRVEEASRGRVFGQAQLVGFSPDLAYSIARTETFWPYFLGLESLLKDKAEAGRGLLVIEEAPVSAGGRALPAKGLEGAADVLLKAVGL
jgi:hypothetical protein